jgi:thioredoxin-like negative regulator of GroEL
MQNELDVLSGMEPQGGMPQPSEAEMQQALASLSPQEKQAAIASLQEIRQIIEQMIAQGATEEEINALLAEVGLSMEELEAAEQLLAVEPQQLGM